MAKNKHSILISPAREQDIPAMLEMIRELAEYERLADRFTATEAELRNGLFGTRPAAEALIAWIGEEPAGYAIFFPIYSTFRARQSLYLEDLYVKQSARGLGIGQKLLAALAAITLERNWLGMHWSVLQWNEPAIGFYQRCGAEIDETWDHYSIAGEALEKLAGVDSQ